MLLRLLCAPVCFQLLDIIQPRDPEKIRLSDLKRSRMSCNFFNTFVNIHKYYEQESECSEKPSVKVLPVQFTHILALI